MILWMIYGLGVLVTGFGLWLFSRKAIIKKDYLAPAIVLIALAWPFVLLLTFLLVFILALAAVLEVGNDERKDED